jgi:NodT family efflux transporter outer membrane factor (OMF) lipoprotein
MLPRFRRLRSWLGGLVALSPCLLLLLCGCTSLPDYLRNGLKVGPNYAEPAAPLAKEWIDATDRRVRTDSDDISKWWENFNDPVLNELITTAYNQNLTLREAGFRILQARAQLGIAVGSIFPQTQLATASYASTAVSGEIAGASDTNTISRQRTFGQWNLGFSLAWEVDFWGRFRRSIESAGANLDASVYDYDDVLVTLLSDVATNYVQMRTLEKRIEYANKNVEIQTDTMKKAQARLKVNVNGALTLDQAIALLKQTEAGVPELQIALRQTTNQLCVLLGIPPEDLRQKLGAGGIPETPEAEKVAVGIPADLLRRRPDVRRAERNAAAQSAQIGVAEADFYPHISLVGNLGFSAQQFKNLFRSSAFNGSVGPSVQWEVLNYGRILNNVRLQDARFQELTATYQQKVLTAQQEVENGLVTFVKAQQRAKLQAESVKAAENAEKIAKTVWDVNGVDFTTVSLIQQNKVQQEDTLAVAQGEIALGLIQIYKALGGGWQMRCNQPIPVAAPAAPHRHSELNSPAPRPAAMFGQPVVKE